MSKIGALNQYSREERIAAIKNRLEAQRLGADRLDDIAYMNAAIQSGLLGDNSQIAYMNASVAPGVFGGAVGGGGGFGGNCVCVC